MAKRERRSGKTASPRRTAGAPQSGRKRGVAAGPAGTEPSPAASPEARHRMIAEMAYYRAEARGFVGGDPVQDWLEAEVEVMARLQQR
jgi:hypothetical protein